MGLEWTRRSDIFGILKRIWIPLVIVVVIGAGGFTVSRLHGVFGTDNRPVYSTTESEEKTPHDPEHLTYEVFGPPGSVADISFFNVDAEPELVEGVPLPWSLTFAITEATALGNISAQGTGDSIGCRIIVGDEVEAEKTSYGTAAFTFCVLKAA
jgi:hypothetical protein